MLATAVALLIAVFITFNPFMAEVQVDAASLARLVGYVAIPFLFFIPLGVAFAWAPLQKAEGAMTPRVLDMFRKDQKVRLVTAWLLIFPLISLLMAFALFSMPVLGKSVPFAVWIVLLGLAVDAAHQFVNRVLSYINPYDVVAMFTQEAKESIKNEHEFDLCAWIDALSEVSLKAIQKHSTSLCNTALNEQWQIARIFLAASKSISHHSEDKQSKAMGIVDKVTYTMFYQYQHLEMSFDAALKIKLEPACSQIISILGKISIDAAKYDISMASPPLRSLGKCARKAQDAGLEEVVIKATCILLEVAKVILQEIDVTYLEIKDPFFSIINNLEEMAKATFRRDKTTSIVLLMQPLTDLKALFKGEKIAAHQDAPLIVQNIDRVLGEFHALQMVMNTLPVIPGIGGEKKEVVATPPAQSEPKPAATDDKA